MSMQHSLANLGSAEQTTMASQLHGHNFDNVYTKKNLDLNNLNVENKELRTENHQYKKLNEKLMNKIDNLQSLIDKEASAHEFYYNYPPKVEEHALLKSKFDKGKSTQKIDSSKP